MKDTDRLNKSIGLSPVTFVPDPDAPHQGRFKAMTRVLGIPLRYDEYPFEWVAESYYKVLRKFHGGPLKYIEGGIRLKKDGAKTDLEVFADIEPRNSLGQFLARAVLRRMSIDLVVSFAKEFEERMASSGKFGLKPPAKIQEAQLRARTKKLDEEFENHALVERLVESLRMESDTDVTRLRPFNVADRWQTDRFETLRMFLYAAKAGLVDITWDVLCPHCRTDVAKDAHLSDLKPDSFCETCDIKFDVDLANSVEVTFKVNQGVRVAVREAYCIGGPANKPDVAAQVRVEPGQERTEKLFTPVNYVHVRIFPTAASSFVKVDLKGDTLYVKNNGTSDALVVIENEGWREAAATAAFVTSLQEFRDLFPEEAVAPGSEVAIGNVAVMFTDLEGSTALYEKTGDTKAFDFILSHFRYLVETVTRHRGGLVKTMGDAIMASFSNGRDALEAAVRMQQKWNAFIASRKIPTMPKLRVGIHQGSAIAINNGGKFDYFGTTVNLAARTEGKSLGADIVFTQSLGLDPEVIAFLNSEKLQVESFQAELKGLTGLQQLFRIGPF